MQSQARENAAGTQPSRRPLVYILHGFSSPFLQTQSKFRNQRFPLAVFPALLHPLVSDKSTILSILFERKGKMPFCSPSCSPNLLPEMGQFKSSGLKEANSQPGFSIYEENKACQAHLVASQLGQAQSLSKAEILLYHAVLSM